MPNQITPIHFVSTDKSLLNLELIHSFLTQSYWSKGIPKDTVKKAIDNSFCFGLYHQSESLDKTPKQIGFARTITDHTTFAYLADVFVLPEHQGKGLGQFMMNEIMNHPELQGLRRMMLATQDAHSLYEKFGFTQLDKPERFMHKHVAGIYQQTSTSFNHQSSCADSTNCSF